MATTYLEVSRKPMDSCSTDDVPMHDGSVTQCKRCLSLLTSITNTASVSSHCMLTRNTTTCGSRNAVFNTLELLDNILVRLPMQDLLQARQINNHWNAVIVTAPRLQRKLFLLPEPDRTLWVLDKSNGTLGKSATRAGGQMVYVKPAQLNPLLFKENPPEHKGSLVERMGRCESINFLARPDLAKQKSICHQMFISQPPATEVEFEFYYEKQKLPGRGIRYWGDDRVRVNVLNDQGVRFGDLVHAFLTTVGPGTPDQPSCGYAVKVRPSRVWMLRVIFASEEEVASVERTSK